MTNGQLAMMNELMWWLQIKTKHLSKICSLSQEKKPEDRCG